ncbi:MAG: hypothetical protein Q8M15_11220 [Bacteroidota bacterium]|nr:hypothetical protein [Bacteroidota bacterium]
MRKLLLLFLFLNVQLLYAQKGFKLYDEVKARSTKFMVGNLVKFKTGLQKDFLIDKIISVSDSGFTTATQGFIPFYSLICIGNQQKPWVAWSVAGFITLAELNLIGAMISGDADVGITAASIFIAGNAVVVPYVIYYINPGLRRLNTVSNATHFVLVY